MKQLLILLLSLIAITSSAQDVNTEIDKRINAAIKTVKFDSATLYVDASIIGKATAAEPLRVNPAHIMSIIEANFASIFNTYIERNSKTTTVLKTYKPAEGTVVFNSTISKFQKFIKGVWVTI